MAARPPHSLPVLAAALVLAVAPRAAAGPLDDPHVGGVGFSGPTTGDLAAIFWNPGALGLLEGNQALIAGGAQHTTTTIGRTAIDPATGAPGGPRAFPETRGSSTVHPATWPLGPGGFAGVGAEIGNRFIFAVAAYTPFFQRASYAPTNGEQPTRYHVVEADFRNVALVPALALRLGKRLRVGVAPGFLFSTGHLVFDSDTALASGAAGLASPCPPDGAPCGTENPQAAARHRIDSGLEPVESSLAFTVAGGAYYRRGDLAFGLAYASRPLGNDGRGVVVLARKTRVERAPRETGTAPICPTDRRTPCVAGELSYGLPDILTFGFTWHARPTLELTTIVRWLNYSEHERLSARLVGPATLADAPVTLTEPVIFHRGFRDAFDVRLRAVRALGSRVRAGVTLRAETSAVPQDRVNPAAVDALKLEPSLALELRAASWLRLVAGYALTLMPDVETGASVFDPTAVTDCIAANGDIDSAACRARRAGTAHPTAAGDYRQLRHTATLAATILF